MSQFLAPVTGDEPMLTHTEPVPKSDPDGATHLQATTKKRKKAESPQPDNGETRRLRRSHEACARCRSKKIKCDSKHPRCSACQQAGTQCHQEDRHRQILTPRGHLETIERQLHQTCALLRKYIPDFSLDALDDYFHQDGLVVDPITVPTTPAPAYVGSGRPFPPLPPLSSTRDSDAVALPARETSLLPSSPSTKQSSSSSSYLFSPAFTNEPMQLPSPPDNHRMQHHSPVSASTFPHPSLPPGQYPRQFRIPPSRPAATVEVVKGQDPQNNDLSNTRTLARGFGVSPSFLDRLEKSETRSTSSASSEDSVSANLIEAMQRPPQNPSLWQRVEVHHYPANVSANSYASLIWLPHNRAAVTEIVESYFERLNHHRPVFTRKDFNGALDLLYTGGAPHDPGFICSVYLILALGSLAELNHALIPQSTVPHREDLRVTLQKVYRPDWPKADEFYERAIAVKPDLRVTISSLQAMILLQWYLYIERHGRSLWRIVGNMTRLAIELGLHHDPFPQTPTFTPEECQLRIRLWGIVMIHDRGTSILLGRPLAIHPSDSSTPRPVQSDGSEHFVLSHPVADIQADIIISLYGPTHQPAVAVMRNAKRILRSMSELRKQLPSAYHNFFGGTETWSEEERSKLLQGVTEDQGLTLLKIWIARILLLRALFNNKELKFEHRQRALVDAIITSHNVIVIHHQLIAFPDIAFFVSPVPLHIAAMVILYGHMCKTVCLPRQVALDDVWLALDMLPSFRWRWERKDLQGAHPLISRVAEKVFEVDFSKIVTVSKGGMLMQESLWWADDQSPRPTSLVTGMSPTVSAAGTPPPPFPIKPSTSPRNIHSILSGSPHNRSRSSSHTMSSSSPTTSNGHSNNIHAMQQMGVEAPLLSVPTGMFYPLSQDNPAGLHEWDQMMASAGLYHENGRQLSTQNGHVAAHHPHREAAMSPYRVEGSHLTQEAYVQEEHDRPPPDPHSMRSFAPFFKALETHPVAEVLVQLSHPTNDQQPRWH